MTERELQSFICEAALNAWADLVAQDRLRGGSGKLHDTALVLTQERTRVTLHANYSDDARMLTSSFAPPQPLPDETLIPIERVGDWTRCEGGFLLGVLTWLQSGECDGSEPAIH
jgi:hypothetical protein